MVSNNVIATIAAGDKVDDLDKVENVAPKPPGKDADPNVEKPADDPKALLDEAAKEVGDATKIEK